jgi:hypothetical protein
MRNSCTSVKLLLVLCYFVLLFRMRKHGYITWKEQECAETSQYFPAEVAEEEIMRLLRRHANVYSISRTTERKHGYFVPCARVRGYLPCALTTSRISCYFTAYSSRTCQYKSVPEYPLGTHGNSLLVLICTGSP